jgi:hypothetical protein
VSEKKQAQVRLYHDPNPSPRSPHGTDIEAMFGSIQHGSEHLLPFKVDRKISQIISYLKIGCVGGTEYMCRPAAAIA